MGIVIAFFRWVWRLLDTALRWCSELPGKLTLFVTTFLAAIGTIFSFFVSHVGDVITLIDSGTSHVATVSGFVSQHSYGSVLVYCTSLDVALSYVVSVVGVFVGAVSTVFLALFGYAMTCWVIPMALMLVQKMISVFTGGFVKT